MGEWNSVEDRLPVMSGNYLVFTEEKVIQVDYFNPGLLRVGEEWRYNYVTHWMPLPVVPEIGG